MQEYGLAANAEVSAVKSKPCIICDDPRPMFAWTDYSGEAYCLKCGATYQLKWGDERRGAEEGYPYSNIRAEAIPMLRRYWVETGRASGLGSFLGFESYPEKLQERQAFNDWWLTVQDEYPELKSKE